jgi:hypothetical protein|tara:strand:- start:797 stop:1756 length:960 start_codon:yes stop_codon:yes gene_type:complete
MSNELDEKFVEKSGGAGVPAAEIMDPATPAGGVHKKKKADVNKKVDPTADKVAAAPMQAEESEVDSDEIVEEVIEVAESIATIFEGMDLSEEFTAKATMVFEAAVNEAASVKAEAVIVETELALEESMQEALEESVEGMLENLDSYLDYVVEEWMTENEVAIEAGIKVEMAESLMDGLKGLFEEHNINVEEETLDVVAELEEEIETLKANANKAIVENVELKKARDVSTASAVFAEMTEGLTLVEQERFKVLSEKLAFDDVDSYKSDLETLKESFFKKAKPLVEEAAEEEALITEDTEVKQPLSEHSTINALLADLNRN